MVGQNLASIFCSTAHTHAKQGNYISVSRSLSFADLSVCLNGQMGIVIVSPWENTLRVLVKKWNKVSGLTVEKLVYFPRSKEIVHPTNGIFVIIYSFFQTLKI